MVSGFTTKMTEKLSRTDRRRIKKGMGTAVDVKVNKDVLGGAP